MDESTVRITSDDSQLISLKNIIKSIKKNELELYKMFDMEGRSEMYQIISVKRMSVTFDDIECQMLNFTNITTFHKLKQEEQKRKLLQALNASVHHEMLSPLSTNVMIANRLQKLVEKE